MKLHQLRALDSVARLGGIRSAARELNRSQPAVSKALHELETVTGIQLLIRGHSGATLSEAGQQLLIRSRAIFRELDYAEMEMRQMAGDRSGKISFGISPLLGQLIMPGAFRAFRKKYPYVQVKMTEALTDPIVETLAEGAVDFAVVLLNPQGAGSNISVEHWFDVNHKIVGRVGHPMGNSASLEDLLAQEWLITNSTSGGQYELLSWICAENGCSLPDQLTEVPSLNLLQSLLQNTDAIAIAPDFSAIFPKRQIQIIECASLGPMFRSFGVMTRTDAPLNPVADAMKRQIYKMCRPLLAGVP